MRAWYATILLSAVITAVSACGISSNEPAATAEEPSAAQAIPEGQPPQTEPVQPVPEQPEPGQAGQTPPEPDPSQPDPSKPVQAEPEQPEPNVPAAAAVHAVTVLVNKTNGLPEDFEPEDLVYPDVAFIFEGKTEKRMLRREAAEALEEMFAAAADDKVPLAGVSGYRSHQRQKELFEYYVRKDGEEKARTYSAYPGTSEHETGLAIDVTGADGRCAATDCFAGTPEADWLAQHAHEYGFIVRYPKGKEDVTGYKYEPWHLRYVGTEAAADIQAKGITLEEYTEAVRVSGD